MHRPGTGLACPDLHRTCQGTPFAGVACMHHTAAFFPCDIHQQNSVPKVGGGVTTGRQGDSGLRHV